MTRAERKEARQLLGNGMLHARLLPLLHAAMAVVDRPTPKPTLIEVRPGIWEWFVTVPVAGRTRKQLVGRGYHVFNTRAGAVHAYRQLMGDV